MPRFFFNEIRAHQVLRKRIYRAYTERTHLYSVFHTETQTAPQQRYIPKGIHPGSREHVVWLFFVVIMNVRSKSSFIFHRATILYERHPELFTEEVVRRSPEEIATILRQVSGFAYPNQWGRRWIHSAKTLFGEYGGNPLLIFKDAPTVEQFLKKKRESKRAWLNGYGHKIYSLFSLFCEELGLIPHTEGAIPVDEHLQRICLTTGVLECFAEEGESPPDVIRADLIASFLRHELSEFSYSNGLSINDKAHALWFLGSQGCSNCSRLKTLELICPVHDLCSGGLDTEEYTNKRIWILSKRLGKGDVSGQKTFDLPEFMALRPEEYSNANRAGDEAVTPEEKEVYQSVFQYALLKA